MGGEEVPKGDCERGGRVPAARRRARDAGVGPKLSLSYALPQPPPAGAGRVRGATLTRDTSDPCR